VSSTRILITSDAQPIPGAVALCISSDGASVVERAFAGADGVATLALATAGDFVLARAHGPDLAGSVAARAVGRTIQLDLAAAAPLWPVSIKVEDAAGGEVPPVTIRLTPAAAPHIPKSLRRWLLADEIGRLLSYVELPREHGRATIALQEPAWLITASGRTIPRVLSPRGRLEWVATAARLADGTELAGDFTGFELPVAGPADVVIVLEARAG
jgi:hypothetical protein